MVKNYQLWYFQLCCSLNFYLSSLPAWGLHTSHWGFLTNAEKLQNQTCHGEKEERQWGNFIYLSEQPKGIIPRSMNNYSTVVSSPLQTTLPSVVALWLAVTALALGNSVMLFLHGLTKIPARWFPVWRVWFSEGGFWSQYLISSLQTLKISDRFLEE